MEQVSQATTAAPMQIHVDPTTVRQAAEVAYIEADGDVALAEKCLVLMIEDSVEIQKSAQREIVHYMVRQAVQRHRSMFFHKSSTEEGISKASDSSALKDAALADGMERLNMWMNYPMSGGAVLGAACKSRVVQEAVMHRAFAAGNTVKARMYTAIAKRLKKDTDIVGEVLTEDDLRSISEDVKS